MASAICSASGRSRGVHRSSRISSSPPYSCPMWRSSSAERHWCQSCCTGSPPSSIARAGAKISCSACPPPTVPAALSAVSTSSAPGARGVAPRHPVTRAVTAGCPPHSARHSSVILSFMVSFSFSTPRRGQQPTAGLVWEGSGSAGTLPHRGLRPLCPPQAGALRSVSRPPRALRGAALSRLPPCLIPAERVRPAPG